MTSQAISTLSRNSSVRIYKVPGSKGGNQVVLIQKKSSKCIFSGTRKACSKFVQERFV